MYAKTTPSGIARPETGPFVSYRTAQILARQKNVNHGRGYRALRAQDGSAAIVFRPSVAGNRQRRVRALSPTASALV